MTSSRKSKQRPAKPVEYVSAGVTSEWIINMTEIGNPEVQAAPRKPDKFDERRQECSREFMDALKTFKKLREDIGMYALCDYCNRLHIAHDFNEDYETLEDADRAEREVIERYNARSVIFSSDRRIHTICIESNKEWVEGCDCNGMRHFEDWITLHLEWILLFAGNRAKRMVRQANIAVDQLQAAAGIERVEPSRKIDL